MQIQREEYDKLLAILFSLLGYGETFKKSGIIFDECTVENKRTEIEGNSKNFWDDKAKFFSQIKKKKCISLNQFCFGPGHKL